MRSALRTRRFRQKNGHPRGPRLQRVLLLRGATRLATQAMEEFQSRTVRADLDQLATQVTADWTNLTYLNAAGVANAAQTPDFRFKRETLVINQGVLSPYQVSVRVTYNLDQGAVKTIRIDQQRRKTW